MRRRRALRRPRGEAASGTNQGSAPTRDGRGLGPFLGERPLRAAPTASTPAAGGAAPRRHPCPPAARLAGRAARQQMLRGVSWAPRSALAQGSPGHALAERRGRRLGLGGDTGERPGNERRWSTLKGRGESYPKRLLLLSWSPGPHVPPLRHHRAALCRGNLAPPPRPGSIPRAPCLQTPAALQQAGSLPGLAVVRAVRDPEVRRGPAPPPQ